MNLTVGGAGGGALGLLGPVAGLAGQTAGLLQQAGQIAGGGGPGLGGFAATLASSALGFLGAGGRCRARAWSPAPIRATTRARTRRLRHRGRNGRRSLFPLSGIMNTVVGSFKSDTVGIARVEQVGTSKVTNVGATFLTSVGKFKKVVVGEEFVIEVGASKFIMRKDGTVIILGTNFNFTGSGPVQINGRVVDLNKPGGGLAEATPSADDSKTKA